MSHEGLLWLAGTPEHPCRGCVWGGHPVDGRQVELRKQRSRSHWQWWQWQRQSKAWSVWGQGSSHGIDNGSGRAVEASVTKVWEALGPRGGAVFSPGSWKPDRPYTWGLWWKYCQGLGNSKRAELLCIHDLHPGRRKDTSYSSGNTFSKTMSQWTKNCDFCFLSWVSCFQEMSGKKFFERIWGILPRDH